MTTVSSTVARLLHWAISEPGPHSDRLPRLSYTNHDIPTSEPARLVAHLAAVTAARLRLGDPPLADDRPAGIEVLPLAVAIALHDSPPGLTAALDSVVAPTSARDLLARHGLVAGVLAAPDGPQSPSLRGELTRHSPLTALFDHPSSAAVEPYITLLNEWRRHGDSRGTLTAALAEPPRSARAARWRAGLLGRYRYRSEDRQWLYDVYETALLTHGTPWLHRTQEAISVLTGARHGLGADAEEEQFDWVEALAAWWGPLAVLVHRHPDELRARSMLLGYEPGIFLHRIHTRAQARAGLEGLLAP